ncbi:LmeA family phospholipid-binding protein [Nocardia yamanashiensis]|uniref:LmeA family phospholipid-binding protein n=1 Tax=Nocardia yamanashiensis TaxID=209247 RepID=UPI0009FCB0FE|nr:DUF2993 domain-containing protein [Nocardia yamanashiensis]
MSSKPTSDDATAHGPETGASSGTDDKTLRTGGGPENGGGETEVIAPGPGATPQPANDAAPTEALGGTGQNWWDTEQEQHTQVLDAQRPDAQPTQVLGANAGATQVLGPQSGAPYGTTGSQPTEVLGAGFTAPQPAEAGPNPTQVLGAGEFGTTGPHSTQVLGEPVGAYPAGPGGTPPPGTPPPTKVGGGEGGSGKVRRTRRTVLIVALVVALLAVGGVAAGEVYTRRTMENCISSQFEKEMGTSIDVSFGWKPLLLTMFDNKVSSVTVDSEDSKFGPAQGMDVHAKFNDIEVKDNGKGGGTIGSSTADVTWSTDGIVKTMGGLVSGAKGDPANGTLDFAVLGGLAELQVKPKIVGDKVEVETIQASLLGFGLPTDLVSGIVQLMTESLQSYPLDMKPTKVEVTNDGLKVHLEGGRTELQSANGQSTTVSC